MVCLCGTSNQLNAHLAPRPTGTRSLARRQKKVPRWGRSCSVELAEEEGFEPPDLLQSTVFKTVAIDHSAILPGQRYTRYLRMQ